MLEKIKKLFRGFAEGFENLFIRQIPSDDKPLGKDSPFKALKEFLTRYPRYIFALFFVAIFPLILATLCFFLLTATKDSFPVPELEGLSIVDAATILQEKKINVSIIPEVSQKYPQNYIIKQDIEAGRFVKDGRVLILHVSVGAENIEFPSFIGKNFYDVRIQMENQPPLTKTFSIGSISWQNSDKPFGEILSQSPPMGSYKDFPVTLNLVLSNGASFALPSVVGQYALSATYTLENLGLSPKMSFKKITDPSADGLVISQNPVAKTLFTPKMPVQIVVGKYNDDVKYFHYVIPADLDSKTIGLFVRDNRGEKILFLGALKAGEVIQGATPVFGKWGAGIYVYSADNTKTLYKDLAS